MTVAMNPKRIMGKWKSGCTLDDHTISSIYLGVNEFGHEIFDTKRSVLGELLYRMKYKEDCSATAEIVEAVVSVLKQSQNKFDVLVPVPPSGNRRVQPVLILAKSIGEALNLPVADCVSTTRSTKQLKGVMDSEKRKELLEGLYTVESKHTQRKSILLFDDLYRSGSTMNAITELLMMKGEATTVRVPAITRTRTIL